jgi:hypothetical protein
MKGNEVGRREIVKGLAIGSAGLVPVELLVGASDWKPRLFTPAQAGLVATLAELIIPRTETPGARDARAHEQIDLVLSEETPEVRKQFLDGLDWIDRRSRKLHGHEFTKLTSEQQTAILTSISRKEGEQHRFFLDIRRRTVSAYYTSEIGIHQELNYQGHQVLDHWEGCPHPDHHGDSE